MAGTKVLIVLLTCLLLSPNFISVNACTCENQKLDLSLSCLAKMGIAVALAGGTSWMAPFALPLVGVGMIGPDIVGRNHPPAWLSYLQSVGMAGFNKAKLLELLDAAPATGKELLDFMGCYTPCECG